ncbi:MAG TPA: D-cysteine desulfhydrase family protein [Acidimicrobiia bacterium]|jgi:D-cysteine desulfhydrase family pyridoxal phosphate-dependent enzyme
MPPDDIVSADVPRVRLAELPTPLQPMDRFSEWLGGPRVLVKRDDLTGLALGGNKARKLEFLCGEAQAGSCDVLVTGGGAQSNHARMTAAAANRLGLDCHLAVGGQEPGLYSGNLLLDRVLGATLHFTGADSYYDVESAIEELAARLAADGRRPFSMPIGGASVTGAAAFAWAADELLAQVDGGGYGPVDWIVVADGSGGTHAGLLAGSGGRSAVLGVDVGTRPDLDDVIPRLAVEAAARAGRAAPDGELVLDRSRFGDGYGAITDGALEAIERVGRLEGIVLDPVYTGKAMAGLIGAAREGRFGAGDTVVFWHTGGAVALFAHRYAELFSTQ